MSMLVNPSYHLGQHERVITITQRPVIPQSSRGITLNGMEQIKQILYTFGVLQQQVRHHTFTTSHISNLLLAISCATRSLTSLGFMIPHVPELDRARDNYLTTVIKIRDLTNKISPTPRQFHSPSPPSILVLPELQHVGEVADQTLLSYAQSTFTKQCEITKQAIEDFSKNLDIISMHFSPIEFLTKSSETHGLHHLQINFLNIITGLVSIHHGVILGDVEQTNYRVVEEAFAEANKKLAHLKGCADVYCQFEKCKIKRLIFIEQIKYILSEPLKGDDLQCILKQLDELEQQIRLIDVEVFEQLPGCRFHHIKTEKQMLTADLVLLKQIIFFLCSHLDYLCAAEAYFDQCSLKIKSFLKGQWPIQEMTDLSLKASFQSMKLNKVEEKLKPFIRATTHQITLDHAAHDIILKISEILTQNGQKINQASLYLSCILNIKRAQDYASQPNPHEFAKSTYFHNVISTQKALETLRSTPCLLNISFSTFQTQMTAIFNLIGVKTC